MKMYIGTKIIHATPAIRKGGKVYLPTDAIPRTMDKVEDGYKVVYEDGYESWSPKEVFEKAYKPYNTRLERLIVERDELKRKCQKLHAFIRSPKYHKLDENEKDLLVRQRNSMLNYWDILAARIKLLQPRKKENE